MSRLAKAKSGLRYVPLEAYLVLALLIAAVFWSGTSSGRSFWGDMACRGYLFPKWIEQKDPNVRRGLNTPSEQKEAFERAARHVGYDERTSKAVGLSAATLCNQKDVR